ncbi:hypothetical protein [Methanosarcina sp. 2.H.A.1B.4]|uniref:hypothetical protein n=1 Tax=Methanosarcina sp. 2.H.A.1B.4 TaxID=1483600 RepID=UPI00062247DE|nr:hypothetical protein [Methanosarcina sp. 2.H.A.1B.4]KKG11181.1 hypothetical protein EO92_17890 [Methanosarcina sp. 2.H.A.1B.4]
MTVCKICGYDHSPDYCPKWESDKHTELLKELKSVSEKNGDTLRNIDTTMTEGLEDVVNEIRYNHEENMHLMTKNLEALTGIGKLLLNSLTVEYCQRYNEALNNYNNKRFDQCLKVLEKAEDLKSDDCRVYLLRGHVYEKQNKLKEALVSYMIASQTVPKNNRVYKAYCLYLISWVYFYMGDIDMAIKEIKESSRLHDIPEYGYQYARYISCRQLTLLKE